MARKMAQRWAFDSMPILTLGLPAHPVMAMMAGAFGIQGIQPGRNVINSQPALFWGFVVSMWIGNAMLVLLNLPLIGIWVKMLRTRTGLRRGLLRAAGLLPREVGCEPAPFLLGFVLGPLLENHLRRATIIAHGDVSTLFTRPISLVLLVVAVLALVLAVLPSIRRRREVVFQGQED